MALWKPATAKGEEAGNLTFVTDGNHNPQSIYCFQTPTMSYPWVKVDLTLVLRVARVVFINTYDEQLCKSIKDTLWVLRRDEPLVHVFADISLITKHILDHVISLES